MIGALMKRARMALTAVALASVLAGCSAVSIETGSTPEEVTARADRRASSLRSTWARGFDQADEIAKADLLKRHIDSSAARFFYLGRQFAYEWERGNDGRGQPIPAEEMRQVIENSIAREEPILRAWEDNLEYGWAYVRDSSRFDDPVKNLFGDMVDHYYRVYSVVFFPIDDVREYRASIDEAEDEMLDLSRDLAFHLRRLH